MNTTGRMASKQTTMSSIASAMRKRFVGSKSVLAISMAVLFSAFAFSSHPGFAEEGSVDADALAKELANPGRALSSLTSKFEYLSFPWFKTPF